MLLEKVEGQKSTELKRKKMRNILNRIRPLFQGTKGPLDKFLFAVKANFKRE